MQKPDADDSLVISYLSLPRNASIDVKREPGVGERRELGLAAESMGSDIVPHSARNVRSLFAVV